MRIHFSAEDLLRVRVVTTLGPMTEAIFALSRLDEPRSSPFSRWRQQAAIRLGPQRELVDMLLQRHPPVPDLVRLLCGSAPCPAGGFSREAAHATVDDFARQMVTPYWWRIRNYLEADRQSRGQLLMSRGLEGLLTTLHPGISWHDGSLTAAVEEDIEVHLHGRGLLLAPSLFLLKRPCVLLGGPRPRLAFPVPPDAHDAEVLFGGGASPDRQAALALVGRTRAQVLHEVRVTRSTGELADRLRISPSAVSQHTGVLRRAGLISSRRCGNTVLHSITELGIDLLAGPTCHRGAPGPARPDDVPDLHDVIAGQTLARTSDNAT